MRRLDSPLLFASILAGGPWPAPKPTPKPLDEACPPGPRELTDEDRRRIEAAKAKRARKAARRAR